MRHNAVSRKQFVARLCQDPRHFQILTLSTLLILSLSYFDPEISLISCALTFTASIITQTIISNRLKIEFDGRSPIITALSLCILLKSATIFVIPMAAVFAIISKFTLRHNNAHMFNPANFGIVACLLLFPNLLWVSPAQWGTGLWLIALLLFAAILVLFKVKSRPTTLAFLGAWSGLLVLRALWLGDPLAIPMHQLQSGAFLIFAFFMISDPKTTPSRAQNQVVFAFFVAMVAYILQFKFQIREAIFYALFGVCFARWLGRIAVQQKGIIMNKFRFLSFLLIFAFLPTLAHAFCGFYVAKADADLFNEASKVIMARSENRTVITMANDYQGELKDFAIVIPVPEVLEEGQVNVSENRIIEHVDAYTAPRLVEYFDPDPCQQIMYESAMADMAAMPRANMLKGGRAKSAKSLGVTIEAEYTVGEYDIVMLSAKQSDGLLTYLNQEGYKLPKGADKTLGSYIKQDMKFFLAKVNLKKQAKSGYTYLRPLQVAFESDKFMLPIRLGTLNAKGPQDLILYTLTKKGRVEAANYRTNKIPTGMDIPIFVKDEFGDFYKSMFDTQVKKDGMKTVLTEYAWDMGWCDPCAADPVPNKDLKTLGVWWLNDNNDQVKPMPRGRRVMRVPNRAANVYVTRLHVRYTAKTFPEDLMLHETADRKNFQGRYVLRHPFTGDTSCEAGQRYRQSLPARYQKEAKNLANLTGWSIADIRGDMEDNNQSFDMPETEPKKPWWDNMWNK